jgi:radical SAM protein with 4Fe4S-binding SPASM domain
VTTDLRRHVEQAYRRGNRLHALIIELTERCCCRCRHCYVIDGPSQGELTTAELTGLLDDARDEGVFHLLLTGGEPLLRPDLEAILAHARTHRFFVSLLTSGLTLDDDTATMLARHKVAMVELSLLGATAAVNDDLMQVPGALERIKAAVARLRDAGLKVVLKATVLRPNQHELPAMAALAGDLGAAFHASPLVVPRRHDDRDPRELALSEAEIAALDPTLLGGGLIPGEDTAGGAVLTCKAGRTVAGITASGDVYPCIMWPRAVGNIRQRSLAEIWHEAPDPFLSELRGLTENDLEACATCDMRSACRRCPGVAWQETGSLTAPGDWFCAAARASAELRPSDRS